jgi:beta-lactamase class A
MLPRLSLLLTIVLVLSACSFAPPAKKEAPADPPPATDPAGKLTAELQSDFARFDGKAGVYAKNLATGKTFAHNQDTVFPTASTHKLVVALATYKYLYGNASPAKQKQYDQNIKKMITVSDNPAFYEMLQEIETHHPDALTKVLADLKLVHTRIHSKEAFEKYNYHSVTTPYEMAVVFETIYNEQYLGHEKSAYLKHNLARTIFKEEIPRFMQTTVMHKTGELPGILTDVGIIDDGKNKILISAYTTPRKGSQQGSNFIANTSSKIYNLLREKNG